MLLIGEQIRVENKKSYVGSVGAFMQLWLEEDEGYTRILNKSKWKDKLSITLFFNCLNPGISSEDLLNECHSAILMSGTLTPTRMYRDLLAIENSRTKCVEYNKSRRT